jgi:hypothetical protein
MLNTAISYAGRACHVRYWRVAGSVEGDMLMVSLARESGATDH